jgi:flagellar biosynthesis GTPase FlhF
MRALDVTISGMPFRIDLLNLVVSGDLEVAYVVLGATVPDDMSMPYHFFTAERIGGYQLKIARKLGWA